jgi:hypothetical protein
MYGPSAADRIAFWKGNRIFKQKTSTFFTFDDDLDERSVDSAHSVDHSASAHSEDHSSEDDDDDDDDGESSCTSSPGKGKDEGESRINGMEYLGTFEGCLPEQKPAGPSFVDVTTRDLNVTNTELPPHMHVIEHMSTLEYDEHDRPVWTFVVYGGNDGTLSHFSWWQVIGP